MVNSTTADIVSNDETVIRYLKKRYYDTATQQWSTDTFELRKGEDCISVCREKLLNSIEAGAKLSFPEKMWKSIIAYTSLEVDKVRGLSTQELTVDVIPVATGDNASHAGITSTADNKLIIGIPTNPAFYNLQGKLLELALPNISKLNIADTSTTKI